MICCLMATVAFSSALSDAGVRYLAASPETILAPGVPTNVAQDVAAHENDPVAMAKAVVATTMGATYGPAGDGFAPAAAFDVIDLDPAKMLSVRAAGTALDSSPPPRIAESARRSARTRARSTA